MVDFVGRKPELDRLRGYLTAVGDRGRGIFLSVRGRRQVGKSRLVEEFLRGENAHGVFFTAAKGAPVQEEIRTFTVEVAQSTTQAAPQFNDVTFDRWEPALRLLASQITSPTVVVLDELPFLIEVDPTFEGVLQRVWDRYLSRAPVLLIVIGSDLSMMEALGRYDRPLFQRMREMVIEPLTVGETAQMLELSAEGAFDAYLVHGGFPMLADAWRGERAVARFLQRQLADPTSPLVVVGERILGAEFPPGLQVSGVLSAIGAGDATFSSIAGRTGLNQGSLTRALHVLVRDKRVVAADRPLSAKPSRLVLYRVADHYLRFWLRFIGPNMESLLRGRGDLVAGRISSAWREYRGRAIEPLVRSAIEMLLPDERFGDAHYVGSFWTRTSDMEVDLVGGREALAPTRISFIGSVKWRERSPFDRRDLADLAVARSRVPGADGARLVGVSRSGFSTGELDVALKPEEIILAEPPVSSPGDAEVAGTVTSAE